MEKTAIQAGTPTLAPPLMKPAPKPKSDSVALQALQTVASLRITVVLFVLSILLVLFGTLAQVDAGIWTVMKQYFRSAYVWVPLQLFVPRTIVIDHGFGFPFPGGWLLGGLLLANLLAAHAIRFKMTWKRSGIFLIHAGIIVMMVSELVTGMFAVESRMSIAVDETVNYLEHGREVELAIIDRSDPKVDKVTVIPEAMLRKNGLIQNELVPFDVEVVEYSSNSALKELVHEGVLGVKDAVTANDGKTYVIVPTSEGTGVDTNAKEDAAVARLVFYRKGTKEKLRGGLYSLWFYPNFTYRMLRFPAQPVVLDGKRYDVEFRFKRTYTDYSLKLLKFTHEVFLGTTTPKNFASTVQLTDPGRKEDRKTTISMNAPLRFAGETFYQSGYFPDDSGTVLQVVNNPGWLMPYFSCAMVALGMIVHFGLHLINFLKRRVAL
jgi:hypothetical protein